METEPPLTGVLAAGVAVPEASSSRWTATENRFQNAGSLIFAIEDEESKTVESLVREV